MVITSMTAGILSVRKEHDGGDLPTVPLISAEMARAHMVALPPYITRDRCSDRNFPIGAFGFGFCKGLRRRERAPFTTPEPSINSETTIGF
jgi:hypothetical protein